MRRTLLILSALVAACGSSATRSCPGIAVAPFSFTGTRVEREDAALAGGLDPVPDLDDCDATLAFPPTVSFDGTISRDATTPAGALCRGNGEVLFGSQSDGRWVVEVSSGGAVLAACGPTCAAGSRTVISGDVLGGTGAPSGFEGSLVEVLSEADGSCGACSLPCATRYELSGAVETP